MNAIDLLKQQHEQVKDALETMKDSDSVDPADLRLLADELVAHMVIEEHVFYPRVKQIDDELVSESFEEHAVARFELARLLVAPKDEQSSRAKVLLELIEHHVEEEEGEMLPEVKRRIPEQELMRLGDRMEAMFERAVEAGFERLVVPQDQSLRSNGRPGAAAGAKGMDGARARAARRGATGRRPSGSRARSHARG